jgi:hypothetical protein
VRAKRERGGEGVVARNDLGGSDVSMEGGTSRLINEMVVSLRTFAHMTARTILAPSLVIPPFSAFEPTMYPVTFTRKSSGIWLCEHN